jgi:hypothetical protein
LTFFHVTSFSDYPLEMDDWSFESTTCRQFEGRLRWEDEGPKIKEKVKKKRVFKRVQGQMMLRETVIIKGTLSLVAISVLKYKKRNTRTTWS